VLHNTIWCNTKFVYVVKKLGATIIGVTLDSEMDLQFKTVKCHFGIKANTDVVRLLIREKYREIKRGVQEICSMKIKN